MNIVNRTPSLQWQWDESGSPTVRLAEVDEDVGHTLIHYLYTSDYQTLRPISNCDTSTRAIEYSRSVFAYSAALTCDLGGLAQHARTYMQILDKDIPMSSIIALGRKTFPRITEDAWFSDNRTAKITASFEADEGIFH
jgi:hypothetical protein